MALEVGICMLFSHGVLMAFNRGNIIIMASLCSMFFVFFKDSENKMVSELALVLLGVAFGLKIYPAVFGILLLYDKQYKKALRATIYGIIMLILPMFVFKEKINGVAMFFHGLFSFAEGSEGTFSARGYTVDGIVNMVSVVLGRAFGFIVNDGLLFSKINYIFAASVLLLGIFLRNKWEKILVCTIAMIICKSQGTYILCFLLIPLLAMIKEEKVVSYQNMLPFTALAMLCILLPLRNERYIIISAMDIKNQMCIMMLLIYVTVMGIYGFRDWFREKLETE